GRQHGVVGDKIVRLFTHACERTLPVVVVSASGGARLQGGMLALLQMAKVVAEIGPRAATAGPPPAERARGRRPGRSRWERKLRRPPATRSTLPDSSLPAPLHYHARIHGRSTDRGIGASGRGCGREVRTRSPAGTSSGAAAPAARGSHALDPAST